MTKSTEEDRHVESSNQRISELDASVVYLNQKFKYLYDGYNRVVTVNKVTNGDWGDGWNFDGNSSYVKL